MYQESKLVLTVIDLNLGSSDLTSTITLSDS